MIYQIHEMHGRHMAQNHLESAANEKAGWKTVTEKEFYDHGRKPVVEQLPTELSTLTPHAFPSTQQLKAASKMLDDAPVPFGLQASAKEGEESLAAVSALYKQTLGKKPHHRMTIDTMKAEINGNSQ